MRDATGGLTLSGGLGPNFRLAKVAADEKKPDGQFRVGAGKAAVLAFLRDLPWRAASLERSMASDWQEPRPGDEASDATQRADVRRFDR